MTRILLIFCLSILILNSCIVSHVEYSEKMNKSNFGMVANYRGIRNPTFSFYIIKNDIIGSPKSKCVHYTSINYELKFKNLDTVKFEPINITIYPHEVQNVVYKEVYRFKNSIKYVGKKGELYVKFNYTLDSCGFVSEKTILDTLVKKRYFEFSAH